MTGIGAHTPEEIGNVRVRWDRDARLIKTHWSVPMQAARRAMNDVLSQRLLRRRYCNCRRLQRNFTWLHQLFSVTSVLTGNTSWYWKHTTTCGTYAAFCTCHIDTINHAIVIRALLCFILIIGSPCDFDWLRCHKVFLNNIAFVQHNLLLLFVSILTLGIVFIFFKITSFCTFICTFAFVQRQITPFWDILGL